MGRREKALVHCLERGPTSLKHEIFVKKSFQSIVFFGKMARLKAKAVSAGHNNRPHVLIEHLLHAKHFANIIVFNVRSSPTRWLSFYPMLQLRKYISERLNVSLHTPKPIKGKAGIYSSCLTQVLCCFLYTAHVAKCQMMLLIRQSC